MKRKSVLSLGITILLGVALAGCSSGAGSGDTHQETTAVEVETTIAQAETASENKTTVSREEAIGAGKKIYEETLETVKNNDYEAYLGIYGGADQLTEEQKQSLEAKYKTLKEYIPNNYPNTEYFIAADDGRNFGFSLINYIVAGKSPNADSEQNTIFYPITYDGKKWRPSKDEEVIQLGEQLNKNYPDEANAAFNAGRNCIDMSNGNDYTWMDSSVTLNGTLTNNVYVMWQNDDGSVGMLVNIKNGNDEALSIKSINVTATDNNLGEIFNVSFNGGIIPAKTSKNYILKVEPENVKTGNQVWGYVNTNSMCIL